MPRRLGTKATLFSAVKTPDRPLSELVAERITQMIIDDSHRGGHKLPNEFVLAERLGVGRSTVREAIKLLVSKNVLEVRHGSGTFVRESTGIVDDPLGYRFVRDKRKLALDLCEIRLMIEPSLAAAAAENAREGQIREMQALCRVVAEQFTEGVDHSVADIGLHQKVAEASGNLVAPGIVGIISTAIPLFIQVSGRSLMDETISTHQRVVDAIAKGNPRAAKKAMREHLVHNLENFQARGDGKHGNSG